jgi:CHAT domain-containing protein
VDLLEGATATALLGSAARKRALIQYSGHAEGGSVVNDPRLLLVPGDDSADVALSDVESLQLGGTDLVVLAACETGVGALRRLAPSASLADGFIGGGATSVISTLWPVDDRSAHEFINTFYRNLRGRSIGDAFAATQRQFLSGPASTRTGTWAAFQLSSM